MKEIITCSRRQAAAYASEGPWAAVQISTLEAEWPLLSQEYLRGYLQLFFVDLDRETGNDQIQLFTTAQAYQVLDFVKQVQEEIDLLLVHCEAGISRSTGMAAALSQIYFGHDGHWFTTAYPNRHVYRTLLEAAFDRGEYPSDRESVSEG